MRKVSTKDAARRFHSLLKDARAAPIMIVKRGRPHAVVMSAADFKIVERILAHQASAAAASLLEGAIDKTASGALGKAVKLRDASLLLGQLFK